jgi:hypothetical protein
MKIIDITRQPLVPDNQKRLGKSMENPFFPLYSGQATRISLPWPTADDHFVTKLCTGKTAFINPFLPFSTNYPQAVFFF